MKKLILSVLFAGMFMGVAEAGVAVIAHPAMGDADAKAIKKLFLGKASELGGGAASPVDQAANSAVRAEFVSSVLGQSMDDNKAHWTEQIFTGQGTPPKELSDDAKVKAHVASTPGAVGYISDSAVDASVKVLLKK